MAIINALPDGGGGGLPPVTSSDNGKVLEVVSGDWAAGSAKAPTANPVFTGSISLGRASGSTVGTDSFAVGTGVTSSGNYSFAEGNATTASGAASHAEGSSTQATSASSHAEGYATKATTSQAAHAEGQVTTASGSAAHSEGYQTTASGKYAHAEGNYTTAQRQSQHVFGEYNVLDSSGTTTTRGDYVEIIGNGTSTSARSNARTLDWSGNERLKGDIYVGCNADSTGGTKLTAPVAMTGADGTNAGTAGYVPAPAATDNTKFLRGDGTWQNTPNELPAVTGSDNGKLLGVSSGVWGKVDAPSGLPSVTSTDNGKVLEVVSGDWAAGSVKAPVDSPVFTTSISLGRKANTTVGSSSTATGYNITASGSYSHAEGQGSTSTGLASHSEGYSTYAQGGYDHAEGYMTQSAGNSSHAENYMTSASGSYSHAEGNSTLATHKSQHAGGEFNVSDPSEASGSNRGTYVEIIGNGTAEGSRSNARALDWNGNEYLKGDLYVGCGTDSTGGTKIVPLPAAPSSDGTYILQCSVSSGTATYSWVNLTTWTGGSY